jgi:GntR family transcriptional regulator
MAEYLIALDPDSPIAPFEQVRSQLAEAMTSGAVVPEYRLPPIRRLATELGLAANTVARAYRELESAGLVETRGRNGTFVVGPPTPARVQATQVTRDFIATMKELGIAPAEIQATLRRELEGTAGPSE